MRAALATLALAVALLAAGPGAACSIMREYPPPTRAQLDQRALDAWRSAFAVVEIEVVTASHGERPGTARVVRVLKGGLPIGHRMRMRGQSSAACGAGDMVPGTRGLLMLPSAEDPHYFPGFLPPDYLEPVLRQGARAVP